MADIEFDGMNGAASARSGSVPILNWAGAALSVGLIAGLAIWGYKLTVRDVAGVPVVRAIEGPMRIQPDDPGGQLAMHQGLAVNQVQAAGAAEPAAERLILAPEPIALFDTDAPVADAMPTPHLASQEVEDVETAISSNSTLAVSTQDSTDIDALVQQVVLNVTQSATVELAEEETQGVDLQSQVVPVSVPGVKVSLRPSPRPAAEVFAQAKAQVASLEAQPTTEMDPDSIALGTRLVQLGAFDSPEIARSEWERLEQNFAEYFRDKRRVVQRAESGGRIFYRLRAVGFDDLSDARRFCSVLLAKEAACIPVVIR